MNGTFDLDAAIRKVPDFPKPGILFYDVTGILTNPRAFSYCIEQMVKLYAGQGFDAVAAVEARGFLFAAPFAERTGLPILLVRKKGKLPGPTVEKRYALEYGEDVIEMHRDDMRAGQRILLVDDLVATGGTLKATVDLIEEAGAKVSEIFCVIGLPFLHYADELPGVKVTTLIDYHGE
jgi:adenine phosphoribosyltransferase